ncbi:MAG: hypothetical protein WC916_00280 [Candidatus Woesearchaeota archaeon]
MAEISDICTNTILTTQSNLPAMPLFSHEESYRIYNQINEKMKNLRREYQLRAGRSENMSKDIYLPD